MEIARSQRLLLRTLEPADRADELAMNAAASGEQPAVSHLPAGTSMEQMVDRWLGEDRTRHVRLVAERLDDGTGPRLVNTIGLTDIIRGVFQNAFIGWKTHPALQRRGYCTEAVQLALRYAFADEGLKLHRVQADIQPDNIASRRVAEKCGFRLEGRVKRYLQIGDQWRDHLMYAVTVEEWPSSRLVPAAIAEFWQRFVTSRAGTHSPPVLFDAFQFGDSPEMADRLARLVAQGVKTATCSALWEYQASGDPLTPAGAFSVVLDGENRPLAVIETVEVALRCFDQVDDRFAFDEGEGDQTLAYWRSAHQAYFSRTLPKIGREFAPEMPLVCERFRVV